MANSYYQTQYVLALFGLLPPPRRVYYGTSGDVLSALISFLGLCCVCTIFLHLFFDSVRGVHHGTSDVLPKVFEIVTAMVALTFPCEFIGRLEWYLRLAVVTGRYCWLCETSLSAGSPTRTPHSSYRAIIFL